MQAQASARHRQHSLRTNKSRASFIESIAAIHLDSLREESSKSTRRNTSDGVFESERRVLVPPRKTKSSIVNLPGCFQMSLKNDPDSKHVGESSAMHGFILDGKKSRRFTYVNAVSPPRVDRPTDNSTIRTSSDRCSLKMPFPSPPPPRKNSIERQSSKKIQPVETFQSDAILMPPHVLKNYNAKEYKEKTHCRSTSSYAIGDVAQSSTHMVIETCVRAALINVCKLKTHDFAFVKRSDGSWTYAILAGYCKDTNNEDIMVFVTNKKGGSKAIKIRDWAKLVRPVATFDKMSNDYVEDVPQIIIADRDANDDWNCSQLSDYFYSFPPINA
eukprot:scaffold48140_cov68-Cyclotella_meneghiniana.AAC.10